MKKKKEGEGRFLVGRSHYSKFMLIGSRLWRV